MSSLTASHRSVRKRSYADVVRNSVTSDNSSHHSSFQEKRSKTLHHEAGCENLADNKLDLRPKFSSNDGFSSIQESIYSTYLSASSNCFPSSSNDFETLLSEPSFDFNFQIDDDIFQQESPFSSIQFLQSDHDEISSGFDQNVTYPVLNHEAFNQAEVQLSEQTNLISISQSTDEIHKPLSNAIPENLLGDVKSLFPTNLVFSENRPFDEKEFLTGKSNLSYLRSQCHSENYIDCLKSPRQSKLPPPYSSVINASSDAVLQAAPGVKTTFHRRPTSLNFLESFAASPLVQKNVEYSVPQPFLSTACPFSPAQLSYLQSLSPNAPSVAPQVLNLFKSPNDQSPMTTDSLASTLQDTLPKMQSFLKWKQSESLDANQNERNGSWQINFPAEQLNSSNEPTLSRIDFPVSFYKTQCPSSEGETSNFSAGSKILKTNNLTSQQNTHTEDLFQSNKSLPSHFIVEPKVAESPDSAGFPIQPEMRHSISPYTLPISNVSFQAQDIYREDNYCSSSTSDELIQLGTGIAHGTGMKIFQKQYQKMVSQNYDVSPLLETGLTSNTTVNARNIKDEMLSPPIVSTAGKSNLIHQALVNKIIRNQKIKNQLSPTEHSLPSSNFSFSPDCSRSKIPSGQLNDCAPTSKQYSKTDTPHDDKNCRHATDRSDNASKVNPLAKVEPESKPFFPSEHVVLALTPAITVTVGEADTSQDSRKITADKKKRSNKKNKKETSQPHLISSDVDNLAFYKNTEYLDSFTFHLKAPISPLKKTQHDSKTTYLNKGQYYLLSLECVSEKLKTDHAMLKSVVMVLFQDASSVGNEMEAWKTWHNKQQSFKQRILDIDYKNSESAGPDGMEEMAFNATAVLWTAHCSPVKVNAAVNCLSTDFSSQKGVKGIPLLMQIDTYNGEELIHRAHCNIKVFCDKGAERKVRDEEKKKDSKKAPVKECPNSPISSTFPSLSSTNFSPSGDFSKIPVLFNPQPEVPIKINNDSTRISEALYKRSFNKAKDTSIKERHLPKEREEFKRRITLYVKEAQETAFTALVLDDPCVQALLDAIAGKCNLEKKKIKNLYKKSKKGILVKIDDQVIRHYADESTFIIHSSKSTPDQLSSSSPSFYDVTLLEID